MPSDNYDREDVLRTAARVRSLHGPEAAREAAETALSFAPGSPGRLFWQEVAATLSACRCGHPASEHTRGPGGGDVCRHGGCGCNGDRTP